MDKLCDEKWCMDKLCVTGGGDGRRREEEAADGRRRTGCRTKNKNPTQRCGEKNTARAAMEFKTYIYIYVYVFKARVLGCFYCRNVCAI